MCAYSRRSELRKVLTELVFKSVQDASLLDYNYNIEQVLWSDSCKQVCESMLVLELFIKTGEGQGGHDQIKRVVVDCTLEETREFVGRLVSIEKEVVAASQGQQ